MPATTRHANAPGGGRLPAALLVIAATMAGPALAVETFEGTEMPAGWSVIGAGRLELSADHAKVGGQALGWQWSAGDRLVFLDATAFENAGGFSAWIYNALASDASLRFRFGTEDQLDGGAALWAFDYPLRFAGWRCIAVNFREDIVTAGHRARG